MIYYRVRESSEYDKPYLVEVVQDNKAIVLAMVSDLYFALEIVEKG